MERKNLVCAACGYQGLKSDFKYIRLAHSAGPDSFRQCPKCKSEIYCDELEDGDQFTGAGVWGAGYLRGHSFTAKKGKE